MPGGDLQATVVDGDRDVTISVGATHPASNCRQLVQHTRRRVMLAIAAPDGNHSETRTNGGEESGGLHSTVMWDDENVGG